MLTTPETPPSSCDAIGVLLTSRRVNSSVGNRSRSTSRFWFDESVRPLDATAICEPFSRILVKLVPRPRMAMLRPSPFTSRVSCTPGMRFSDSAMFRSGNLPMSSANTESVMLTDSRFALVALSSDARKPVTTTSLSSSLPCSAGCAASAAIADPVTTKPAAPASPSNEYLKDGVLLFMTCPLQAFFLGPRGEHGHSGPLRSVIDTVTIGQAKRNGHPDQFHVLA